MITFSKQQSFGEWSLRVEETKGQETVSYDFYDEKHLNSRLSIRVTQNFDGIFLEILPF